MRKYPGSDFRPCSDHRANRAARRCLNHSGRVIPKKVARSGNAVTIHATMRSWASNISPLKPKYDRPATAAAALPRYSSSWRWIPVAILIVRPMNVSGTGLGSWPECFSLLGTGWGGIGTDDIGQPNLRGCDAPLSYHVRLARGRQGVGKKVSRAGSRLPSVLLPVPCSHAPPDIFPRVGFLRPASCVSLRGNLVDDSQPQGPGGKTRVSPCQQAAQ